MNKETAIHVRLKTGIKAIPLKQIGNYYILTK